MKRLTASIGVAIALVVASVVIGTSPASAHTPAISVSCDGIVLKATAYDGNKANKWSVNIAGAVSSGTFGDSFNRTFPVPQGGASTTWYASIEAFNGDFSQTKNGTVGPCGTVPVVRVANPTWTVTVGNCDVAGIVILHDSPDYTWGPITNETAVATIVGENKTFLNGEKTYIATGLKTTPRLPDGQCMNGTQPPNLVEFSEWAGTPNCETKTLTETRTRTETAYVADGRNWVKGTPVVTTETKTRETTKEECPVVIPPFEPPVVTVPPVVADPPAQPPVADKPPKNSIGTPISIVQKPVIEEPNRVLPNTGGPDLKSAILGGSFLMIGMLLFVGLWLCRTRQNQR